MHFIVLLVAGLVLVIVISLFVRETSDSLKGVENMKIKWQKPTLPDPDVDALVACGRRLAALFFLPPAPEEKVRSKIKEILFDREKLECFRQGLITREELRGGLLAHLETLISQCAGAEGPKTWEDDELLGQVELALRIDNEGRS
jgi:hypothetical protein